MVPRLREARLAGEATIRALRGPVCPADLGYDRQDMRAALRCSMEMRERFTVMRLASLCGTLDELSEQLLDEFC
jgi:hypothetical protein